MPTDQDFKTFWSTLYGKHFTKVEIYRLQDELKEKYNLWNWADITDDQMKEVMEYVKSLPMK
jgi:hypothetical protein